jgi:hypothetical protein
VATDGAAGDIIDVEPAAGFLRRRVLFSEGEDRTSRNDEQAPQFGQAGDDVMGQAIGEAAAPLRFFKERHYGE